MNAPRVRDQPRAHARLAREAHGVEHRLIRVHAGEEAVDETRGLHAEERRELRLEDVLAELALLECDEKLAEVGIRGETLAQLLRLDASAHTEVLEGREQVRRQHAAPVHEQAAALPARRFLAVVNLHKPPPRPVARARARRRRTPSGTGRP